MRLRPHHADVSEVLCGGLPAQPVPVEPVPGEVLALDEHVRRRHEIAGDPGDRGIVPGSDDHLRAAAVAGQDAVENV